MRYLNYTVTGHKPRRVSRGETARRAAIFALTAAMVAGFTVWAVNVAIA